MVTCTTSYPNANTCFTFTISPREMLLVFMLFGALVQFAALLPRLASQPTHEIDWHSVQHPVENQYARLHHDMSPVYGQQDGLLLLHAPSALTSHHGGDQQHVLAVPRKESDPLPSVVKGRDNIENGKQNVEEDSELDDDEESGDDEASGGDDEDSGGKGGDGDDNYNPDTANTGREPMQLTNGAPSRDFHHHLAKKDEDGFAACLLIMDDNHYLIEWLAYHYHFLPLRRLIVAVDPASRTSPRQIFDRYRHLINITVWGDKELFVKKLARDDPVFRHRKRQKFLISRCSKQLKDEGRNWVANIDTDEFVAIHSGALQKYRVKRSHPTLYQTLNDPANNNTLVQPISPCITMRRDQMSNRAAPQRWDDNLEHPFAWDSFNTLRQRFRARKLTPSWRKKGRLLAPKAIVNVQRVTKDSLSSGSVGPHRPSLFCDHPTVIVPPSKAIYIVHHYPGTLEQFNFRSAHDPREDKRSTARYNEEFNLTTAPETNDLPFTWVDDFVEKVGMSLAKILLEGIGSVEL